MRLRFWGSRGSLPTAADADQIRRKIVKALEIALAEGLSPGQDVQAFLDRLPFWVRGGYGGNTSCVQVEAEGAEPLLLDAGSGLREAGRRLAARPQGPAVPVHILLSHPHWDHIQGFPFFIPAYVPGARITIYGGHDNLEAVFKTQQKAPFFPVDFGNLAADISFVRLHPGELYDIGGFSVSCAAQTHPGGSFGYRVARGGKTAVYSTDCEHHCQQDVSRCRLLDFFRGADVLVFDAQYTFAEAGSAKENWGHSSNLLGVETAKAAAVPRLVLFHQEPALDDEALDKFLTDTRAYAALAEGPPLDVQTAYDGLEIEV